MKLKVLLQKGVFAPADIPERMTWTASSIKMFRDCKRKFYWKYMMRLRPRFRDKNLSIGSAFHDCLAQWYKGKRVDMKSIALVKTQALAAELQATQSFFDQDDLDKFQIAIDTFTGMMMGYAQNYEADRGKWDIDRTSVEREFKVDMGDFDYAGKLDLVASTRKGRQRNLVEHKSAAKIHESYLDRIILDTQIRGYVFVALKCGYPVKAVLYDVIEKCKLRRRKANGGETIEEFAERVALAYTSQPTRYFYREEVEFDKGDIDAFEFEIRQTNKEYQAIVRGDMGNPQSPRAWTPNDHTCEDYYKTCEYFDGCTIGIDKGMARKFDQHDVLHEELKGE